MKSENRKNKTIINKHPTCTHRAFTLAEVLVAMILIGLAIVSLLAGSRAFTQVNSSAVNLTTAEFLIDQIQELTTPFDVVDPQNTTAIFGPEPGESLLDYDDIDDFDGASFCPPINANRQQLNEFGAYTQQITVENVSETDFEVVVADHSTPFVRVTVRVFLQGEQLNSRQWLRARY
jgi:type II secretory pathway pseudopilin PulG